MTLMRLTLAAVLWIGLLTATRAVNTYYVATNGTGNGTTWALATSNIQAAVNSGVDDDVVLVSNGTYYCWSNSAASGYTSMVTVTKRVTIRSVNGPEVTIVNANYPAITNRCFYITATATVAGFTITNGHTCEINSGGGVFINLSGIVTNCWITGNSVTNGTCPTRSGGGGVHCYNAPGVGQVINCRIYSNIATNNNGPGVYVSYGGLIKDCVISNNIANPLIPAYDFYTGPPGWAVNSVVGGCLLTNCTIVSNWGGGLSISGASTVDTCRIVCNTTVRYQGGAGLGMDAGVVRNCFISDNVCTNCEGGGVYMSGGIVSNCVINHNYAIWGGAGFLISSGTGERQIKNCTIISNITPDADSAPGGGFRIYGSVTIRNCLIADNFGFGGGGIYYAFAGAYTVRVENCTIVSNRISVYRNGGGISCSDGSSGTGVVINTIIYANTNYNAAGNNWLTNDTRVTFLNCCTTPTILGPTNLPGSGNISNAPAFVNFAARNFRLARGSPCINAGTNLDWMINAVDLDGLRRLDGFGGRPDMGCYEFVPAGTRFRVR